MMRTNVKSALYGMQEVLPHFKERGAGQIVNVSSMLGRMPFATFRSAYCGAKHFLNALTATFRAEVQAEHPGIQVTLVSPGVVRTDFGLNARHGGPDSRTFAESQSAEEVAAVIAGVIASPRPDVYTRTGAHDRDRGVLRPGGRGSVSPARGGAAGAGGDASGEIADRAVPDDAGMGALADPPRRVGRRLDADCQEGRRRCASITYAEALDVALRHGWIDSQKKRGDDGVVPAEVHAARAAQRVVEGESRKGGAIHGRRRDEAGRAAQRGARARQRPVGPGL